MQIEWFGESPADQRAPSVGEFYVTGFRDGFLVMLELSEETGVLSKAQSLAVRQRLVHELRRRAKHMRHN